jgi:hypothetical protein
MSSPDDRRFRPAQGSGAIALAIVAAAFILAWASPNPVPRYQLAAANGSIVRLDTDSGAIIACSASGCRQIRQPDRAKTLGPIGIQIGKDNEPAQLPANEQSASR